MGDYLTHIKHTRYFLKSCTRHTHKHRSNTPHRGKASLSTCSSSDTAKTFFRRVFQPVKFRMPCILTNRSFFGIICHKKKAICLTYNVFSPRMTPFQLKSSSFSSLQEEIDKETRQKMDQFFAKVELTKNFQRPGKLRWRCCSGSEIGARRNELKSSLELGKRPHTVKNHGYRRAQPWPTQVWS